MACPCPLFRYLSLPAEEGRPVSEAKKTKIKETNLLSLCHHLFRLPSFEY
jgi:hypothetical protein